MKCRSCRRIDHSCPRPDKIDRPIGINRRGWIAPRRTGAPEEKAGLDKMPERILLPEPQRQGLVSARNAPEGAARRRVPVVHGTLRRDGTLQGLLELADVRMWGRCFSHLQ